MLPFNFRIRIWILYSFFFFFFSVFLNFMFLPLCFWIAVTTLCSGGSRGGSSGARMLLMLCSRVAPSRIQPRRVFVEPLQHVLVVGGRLVVGG